MSIALTEDLNKLDVPLARVSLPGEYITIPLYAGWNDIAYIGKTGDITMLTSNIVGLEMIYLYEAGTWFWYNPSWPTEANTLPTLEYGKAYWIKVTTDQAWEVPTP